MKSSLALFEQARDTVVPKLGPDHPQTLRILSGLAGMYRAYRRTGEAIELFEQIRDRKVQVLGSHHPATLTTLFDLAMAYVDAGESGKALPLFQQAAVGVEKLGYAHDAAERIVNELARCHEQLNQYDQCEVWRRKWLAVVRAKAGPSSLNYASVRGLSSLGANLLEQKKYAHAEQVLRENLAVMQEKAPGVWETYRVQALLGGALVGRGNYHEAERHLVCGHEGLKEKEAGRGSRFYGPSPAETRAAALKRLVQFYEVTNKPDEAAKWRKVEEAPADPSKPPTKPKGG